MGNLLKGMKFLLWRQENVLVLDSDVVIQLSEYLKTNELSTLKVNFMAYEFYLN